MNLPSQRPRGLVCTALPVALADKDRVVCPLSGFTDTLSHTVT